jgi:hypothetical protein
MSISSRFGWLFFMTDVVKLGYVSRILGDTLFPFRDIL